MKWKFHASGILITLLCNSDSPSMEWKMHCQGGISKRKKMTISMLLSGLL